MRAVRKKAGLTQTDIAQKLETSQSAVSKIEAGSLAPPLMIWMQFCKEMGINPVETLETGYVDFNRVQKAGKLDEIGKFKVPSRYLTDCGTSVRWVLPILKFYESRHGEEALEKMLSKTMKIDPDFFVILDHSINIQFGLDLIHQLIKTGDLHPEDLMTIGHFASGPDLLASMRPVFDRAITSRDKLLSLISNFNRYEANFIHQVESQPDKNLLISVSPQEHLKHFDYRNSELGSFLCEYKKTFLKSVGVRSDDQLLKIDEHQCIFKGADRCVYEIQTP
ncbi:MAG: helix-turn-helix transcriptional regulator [Oligoflexia bacterium]|nr:helix-turn-helix transcriptional regulator [Oligoflexia bacterium]